MQVPLDVAVQKGIGDVVWEGFIEQGHRHGSYGISAWAKETNLDVVAFKIDSVQHGIVCQLQWGVFFFEGCVLAVYGVKKDEFLLGEFG